MSSRKRKGNSSIPPSKRHASSSSQSSSLNQHIVDLTTFQPVKGTAFKATVESRCSELETALTTFQGGTPQGRWVNKCIWSICKCHDSKIKGSNAARGKISCCKECGRRAQVHSFDWRPVHALLGSGVSECRELAAQGQWSEALSFFKGLAETLMAAKVIPDNLREPDEQSQHIDK